MESGEARVEETEDRVLRKKVGAPEIEQGYLFTRCPGPG